MSDLEVTIDVNYDCNMNCLFCSTKTESALSSMSDNVAQKSCDFMANLKQQNDNKHLAIVVTGGEPLLFDKLKSFLETWSKVSDEVILCTNGTVAKSPKYWKNLYAHGLRVLRLSLHGTSETSFKTIFGSSYSFSTVKETIEIVKKEQIAIDINYVLSKANADQLESVFQFCSDNKIRTLRILGLAKQGRAVNNWDQLNLSKTLCKELLAKAREMSSAYGVNIKFAGLSETEWCSHSDDNGNCSGGKTFFHITANGDIFPCPGVKSVKRCKIGSVMESSNEKLLNRILPQETSCLVLNQSQQGLK